VDGATQEWKARSEVGQVNGEGEITCFAWVSTVISLETSLICIAEHYDQDARRYHQAVYQRKRANLHTILNRALLSLYSDQLRTLHAICLQHFKNDFEKGISEANFDFSSVVHEARAQCETLFNRTAEDSFVEEASIEDARWNQNTNTELERLREDMQNHANEVRRTRIIRGDAMIEVGAIFVCNSTNFY
jgi:Root hair defective 3 GTP-binding protein (RHD3)